MAKKSNAGRPTIMTEEALRKLDEAFANGATDLEACFYAGISKTAFYNYQERNPEYVERKEGLKDQLKLIAKNTLAKSIKDGSALDAKWFLERKCGDEYAPTQKNTNQTLGKDGTPVDPPTEIKINLVKPDGT